MIVLDPNKTTGKQLIKIINTVMVRRAQKIGTRITWTDFCRISQLSKAHVIRFKNGRRPGVISFHKTAAALESWGEKVTVKKLNLNIKYHN